ncbi:MAG TPA: BamA/TamA family outer membrane protein, partial [Anaeromyxobacteraceae bacterium]|nr:BamA/TamA family outer membrane protein [Anaeromyxobacteraceae bacterium]
PAPGAEPEPAAPAAEPIEAAPQRVYLVERIAFTGLSHVKAWAARRHVVVAEGAPLDEFKVVVSRLRLLQLGWFSRVETRLEKGSARGLVVLVFDVTERNTLVVSDLVVGSTRPQPVYGGLGLTQQNFLGEGLGLSGAFAYGGSPLGRPGDPDRFALRGAFFAPDVGVAGQRFVAGASALWLRGEELACADPSCDAHAGRFGDAPRLRYQRAGGEVSAGVRTGPFERVTAGLRWERIRAEAIAGPSGPEGPVPPVLLGHSNLAALTATWELDSRDDRFFPTEGLLSLAQITFASKLLGSDYEYSRYLFQLESGFGLFGQPLRLQGLVGAAQGGAPFFERFYAADLSYFAVGPALGRAMELNFSTDSRYDAFAAMGGLEYGVPLWSRGAFFHRGYLAFGARAVYTSATLGGGRTHASRWPVSFDVALRVDTPVGTFNASLGAALDNAL